MTEAADVERVKRKSRAQAAYEAYCAELYVVPDWDGLKSNERDAWWAAVLAVDDTPKPTEADL